MPRSPPHGFATSAVRRRAPTDSGRWGALFAYGTGELLGGRFSRKDAAESAKLPTERLLPGTRWPGKTRPPTARVGIGITRERKRAYPSRRQGRPRAGVSPGQVGPQVLDKRPQRRRRVPSLGVVKVHPRKQCGELRKHRDEAAPYSTYGTPSPKTPFSGRPYRNHLRTRSRPAGPRLPRSGRGPLPVRLELVGVLLQIGSQVGHVLRTVA